MNKKIEKLAKEIYKEIEKMSKNGGICVTNRMLTFDYAALFKLTGTDYSADCVLAERIFPKSICKESEIEVKRPPKEAQELESKILELGFDLTKTKSKKKQLEIEKEIEDLKISRAFYRDSIEKEKVLTFEPFNDGSKVIVLELKEDTKELYKSFCYQIATFVFTYFMTLKMFTMDMINIKVLTVKGINSVDIVCRII